METLFVTEENGAGRLLSLRNRNDRYQMNWVRGAHPWGTVFSPSGVSCHVKREILDGGNLRETYRFENTTSFPVFFQMTDLGICMPLPDHYTDAATCMVRRCHTHIFCGGEASYVMALRMGGEGPHLGMILTDGALKSYSVERSPEESSNDRGVFILHPDIPALAPGEEKTVDWELFWMDSPADFEEKALSHGSFPMLQTSQCTWFVGETLCFRVRVQNMDQAAAVITCNGAPVDFTDTREGGVRTLCCEYPVACPGELHFTVELGDKQLRALFYGCLPVETLLERRCGFLAEKQQYHGKVASLEGAYLIYDNEEEQLYYSHDHDHNGGRERLAMGALMALALQDRSCPAWEKSLDDYIAYVYRELYDRETGVVFNDISRNLEWHRLYNYPWMAIFQMEVYKLKKQLCYLKDACRTMERYYLEGGEKFYALGIPMTELARLLDQAGLNKERERILSLFRRHVDHIAETGTNYPAMEVRYEQSIVAPAVDYLLQGYQLFGDSRYLDEAKAQIRVLRLFHGHQPDYRQFENAIRHWDGYWFGKRKNYGDTYPHYWSVTSALCAFRLFEITGDRDCREWGGAVLRGVLNLFFPDGRASCAMVFPASVNGRETGYYDPWANDQDWGLYYAWMLRHYLA